MSFENKVCGLLSFQTTNFTSASAFILSKNLVWFTTNVNTSSMNLFLKTNFPKILGSNHI